MSPRAFVVSFLLGAVSLSASAAAEQPAPSLMDRCRRMLELQTAVANGTGNLQNLIEASPDGKPRPEHRQTARNLTETQAAIVDEARRAIEEIEAEGSAAAFARAFGDVRKDMKHVQRRLAAGDVGSETQALLQEIIDALHDVIEALKPK
jgi:hypothetical protein